MLTISLNPLFFIFVFDTMRPKRVGDREIIVEFSEKVQYAVHGFKSAQLNFDDISDPNSYEPLSIPYPYIKRIRDKNGNILWENREYEESSKLHKLLKLFHLRK